MKWLKAFRTWMRVVLPFEVIAIIWVAAQVLVCSVLIVMIAWGDREGIAGFVALSTGISAISALIYGIYRAWYFHPVENRSYGEWLQIMPWTPADPLPLGPVHFVWQDAVVLVALGLNSPTPVVTTAVVMGLFVSGFCVSQATFAVFRKEMVGAYGFLTLLGIGIIGMLRLEIIVPVAIGMCFIAHISNRRLLKRFHTIDLSDSPATQGINSLLFFLETPEEGWPAGFLCRGDNRRAVPQWHAIGIALIAGWISYALTWHFPFESMEHPDDVLERTISGGAAILLYIILPRLGLYCWNFRPPISILGRIATGKIIIPGYDKVFVFAFVVLAGWFTGYQFVQMGYDGRLSIALATSLVVWGTLGVGPSLRKWGLTGRHRIVPGIRKKQMFESL